MFLSPLSHCQLLPKPQPDKKLKNCVSKLQAIFHPSSHGLSLITNLIELCEQLVIPSPTDLALETHVEKHLFIYLWLRWVFVPMRAAPWLWWAGILSTCSVPASPVAERGLWAASGFSHCSRWAQELGCRAPGHRLTTCGTRVHLPRAFCTMWDLPRPGINPGSPALAVWFVTVEPLGKPLIKVFTADRCSSLPGTDRNRACRCNFSGLSSAVSWPFCAPVEHRSGKNPALVLVWAYKGPKDGSLSVLSGFKAVCQGLLSEVLFFIRNAWSISMKV